MSLARLPILSYLAAFVVVSLALLPLASAQEYVVQEDTRLTLRGGPGTGFARQGLLGGGTPVTELERRGTWSKVKTSDGSIGWVHNGYLDAAQHGGGAGNSQAARRGSSASGQRDFVLSYPGIYWNGIQAIAVSSDDRLVLTAHSDSIIRLWNRASGRMLRSFAAPQGSPVNSIAFSPNGRYLLVGTGNSGAAGGGILSRTMLYETITGRLRHDIPTGGGVYAVAFSPDGKFFAAGGGDKLIRLFNVESGKEVRQFVGHERAPSKPGFPEEAVTSIAFSPDGDTLVSGAGDRTVRLWDVRTGEAQRILKGHGDKVWHVAFAPDGRRVASASQDGTIRVWSSQTGQWVWQIAVGSTSVGLSFSQDGKWLVYSDDKSIHALDSANGQRITSIPDSGAFAFADGGSKLLVARAYMEVRTWDVKARRQIGTFSGVSAAPATRIAVSPSGRYLAVIYGLNSVAGNTVKDKAGGTTLSVSTIGGNIRIFDTQSGESVKTIELSDELDRIYSAGFTEAGDLVVISNIWKDSFHISLFSGKTWLLQKSKQHFSKPGLEMSDAFLAKDARSTFVLEWDENIRDYRSYVLEHGADLSAQETSTISLDHFFEIRRSHRATSTIVNDGKTNFAIEKNDIHLSSARTGEKIGQIVVPNNRDWVFITPEGFFSASFSEEYATYLSLVYGLEAVSLVQAYQSLFRPDLVREKLAGDPEGRVRQAAERLDLAEMAGSGRVPQIQLAALPASVTSEAVVARAMVKDMGGGIGRIEWRVNGVVAGIDQDENLQPIAGEVDVARRLLLDPGENRIEIVAYNKQELFSTRPVAAHVTNNLEAVKRRPRMFALAVGVNDYWDSRLKLNYAVPDAMAIAESLRKASEDLYESIEITTMLDEQVTVPKLDAKFEEISRAMRTDDVFVFFLAGHGRTENGIYYFLPYDYRHRNEQSLLSDGISIHRFQEWFARLPARKSVLLFDSCESGSIAEPRFSTRATERFVAIDKLSRAIGRTTLAAATGDALEGYRGHGVFTYTVLEAIGAAGDEKEYVGVTDLAAYIDERIPALSQEVFEERQQPQIKIEGGNFPLVRQTYVLTGDGDDPDLIVSGRPTHVVVAAVKVRKNPGSEAAVAAELPPGARVRIMEDIPSGWSLVARDGRRIGYVKTESLLRLQ